MKTTKHTQRDPDPRNGTLKVIKQKLAAREDQLNLFIRCTPAAVAMLDKNLRYIAVSDRWYSDYGIKEKDIIGKLHYDIFPEIKNKPDWQKIHQKALKGEVIKKDEDVFVRKDNRKDYIRWEIHPWKDLNQNIGGIIMFTEVITEYVKARRALVRREKSLIKAHEFGKLGTWEWDLTNDKVYWSDNFFNILETEKKNPVNSSTILEYVHPADKKFLKDIIQKSSKEKRAFTVQFRVITAHQNLRYIKSLGESIKDKKGNITRLTGFVQDITSRVKAENEIKKLNELLEKKIDQKSEEIIKISKEILKVNTKLNKETIKRELVDEDLTDKKLELKTITDNVSDMISVYDEEGNYLYVSPSCEKLLGYKPKELMGHNCYEFFHSDSLEEVKDMHQQILEDHNKEKAVTYKIRKKDNTYNWFETTNKVVEVDNEPRIISISRDISNRLEIQSKLKAKTRMLEQVNAELESFSYSVSHDLRAPLRALEGFTNALYENYKDSFDDSGKRWLNYIKENAIRMDTLIQDILHFSKINKLELQKAKFDTKLLIEEVYRDCSRSYTQPIEFSISGKLPQTYGDRIAIKQVWQNLISNALKFSAKKKVIKITITGKIEEDKTIFSISDNGVGFDEKYVDKLFKTFQRLHKESEFEGTGIGLAIVKIVIEKHQGTIKANSKQGKGAVISFKLPLQEE